MTFTPSTYTNFVSAKTASRERLFLQYMGARDDFDIAIVGSGIGGGVLADDLADRRETQKRILVLEAVGTPKDEFITEPTGVFNTAELLVNQVGLTPGVSHGDGPGLSARSGTGRGARVSAGGRCTTRPAPCGCPTSRSSTHRSRPKRSWTKTSASRVRNGSTSATCR
jgi:hypothetical protein